MYYLIIKVMTLTSLKGLTDFKPYNLVWYILENKDFIQLPVNIMLTYLIPLFLCNLMIISIPITLTSRVMETLIAHTVVVVIAVAIE